LRAIQADYAINGVFNVCSGNFTVGNVADLVKEELEGLTGKKIYVEIKNLDDFRNYKVSIEKAKIELGFQPQYSIKDIVADLYSHKDTYGNLENDDYCNIKVFKKMPAS
jgi:nucleoside-diphosphate-sugar epimerase